MTGSSRGPLRLVRLGLAILVARWEGRRLGSIAERAAWQQRQAARMLAALDVDVRVIGHLPSAGLMVCNHVSYLDILAIAAQGNAVFVAKSDVRTWPAIGGLLECAGTILAERRRPLSASTTSGQIRRVLDAGVPVVLFPEGTSSDGSEVLPFMPSLLQAALDAGAPITPAAIHYQADGGDVSQDVCYWGDAMFFPHLIRLTRLPKIMTHLTFGEVTELPPNRKAAAKALHAAVSALMKQKEATRWCGPPYK